jgi:hypothetical protein
VLKFIQVRFLILLKAKKKYTNELNRIKKCSILANKLNIEVHAGHGLDYKTTKILSKIKEIEEFQYRTLYNWRVYIFWSFKCN